MVISLATWADSSNSFSVGCKLVLLVGVLVVNHFADIRSGPLVMPRLGDEIGLALKLPTPSSLLVTPRYAKQNPSTVIFMLTS